MYVVIGNIHIPGISEADTQLLVTDPTSFSEVSEISNNLFTGSIVINHGMTQLTEFVRYGAAAAVWRKYTNFLANFSGV